MKHKLYYVCVIVRLSIAAVVLVGINPIISGISVFGFIALAMSLGFAIKHWRHDKVGFFGGEVWWHDLRKFHAGIWLLVSAFLFLDQRWAGFLIIYDIIPGLLHNGVSPETADT